MDVDKDHAVPHMDKTGVRVMMEHYRAAIGQPNKNIMFLMTDTSNHWYILIRNLEMYGEEFKGGEYIVEMIAPADFPFNPPRFFFKTPNGVYEMEKKVCISIGEYHKDQYRATLGMQGFARELWNGMVNWRDMGGGINIIRYQGDAGKPAITRFAEKSAGHNAAHHAELVTQIKSAFEEYSQKWVEELRKKQAAYKQHILNERPKFEGYPKKWAAYLRKLAKDIDPATKKPKWADDDEAIMNALRTDLIDMCIIEPEDPLPSSAMAAGAGAPGGAGSADSSTEISSQVAPSSVANSNN